jgi:hypothetical protein
LTKIGVNQGKELIANGNGFELDSLVGRSNRLAAKSHSVSKTKRGI